MHRGRIGRVTPCWVGILLLLVAGGCAGAPLGLRARMSKSVYEPGERIALTARLENLSGEPVRVVRRLSPPGSFLFVFISSGGGAKKHFNPGTVEFDWGPYVEELTRGRHVDAEVVLYDPADPTETMPAYQNGFPPGEYEVEVVYQVGPGHGDGLWIGNVKAEPIHFTVRS